jgi:hypothetical protein
MSLSMLFRSTVNGAEIIGYTDEEISTPWPSDDSLSTDNMRDFLDMETPTGKVDNSFCSTVKTITLLHRALR